MRHGRWGLASSKDPETLSVRLTLSTSDKELFEHWAKSFDKSRSSMATYMVQYFVRTVPPEAGLPHLPLAPEPAQGRLI